MTVFNLFSALKKTGNKQAENSGADKGAVNHKKIQKYIAGIEKAVSVDGIINIEGSDAGDREALVYIKELGPDDKSA